MLKRLIEAVADLVRWAEPWDYETDDDPLLSRPTDLGGAPVSIWA